MSRFRPRAGKIRRKPTLPEIYAANLREFDGRLHPEYYGADDLEQKVIDDAAHGYDVNSEAIVWWAVEAYIRIARLTQRTPEAVFVDIAARVTARRGRPWPVGLA